MNDGLLVVGLGNPGIEYENTRHNAGFMVADELYSRTGASGYQNNGWQNKFSSLFTKISINNIPIILLKPQTFMNLSGRSVARAAQFYQFEINQIVILHDDLDINFDSIRVKDGGGTGGHNGIASCKKELGTTDFLRVRIGIGRPQHGDVTNYVLQKFSQNEMITMTDVMAHAADAVETISKLGIVKTMNTFNNRQGDNK